MAEQARRNYDFRDAKQGWIIEAIHPQQTTYVLSVRDIWIPWIHMPGVADIRFFKTEAEALEVAEKKRSALGKIREIEVLPW